MGLDAVELIMEVEETFDLSIEDDEYVRFKTVGDLHQFLVEKFAVMQELQVKAGGCLSLAPFLDVRRTLVALANIDRSSVRPKTSLETVIPLRCRRQLWNELQSATHIRLPALVLPDGFKELAAALLVCGFLIVAVATAVWLSLALLVFAGVALLLLSLLIFRLTRPLATAFPANCETVSDLVRFARPPHYPSQRLSGFAGDSDAIWTKLVEVVVSALGVQPSDVTPDARFREDLMVG